MNSKDRRNEIQKLLYLSKYPIKGGALASKFNVTRQVIVKDIAILRAEGLNIIATPEGYIFNKLRNLYKKVFAIHHSKDDIRIELETIIKYGGIIEDIIVEHPLYGEIKAMIMIKTLDDINNFIRSFDTSNAMPLSILTEGIHLHTISAETEEILDKIEKDLSDKRFILGE